MFCACSLDVQQNRQNTSTPSTVNQSLTKNLAGLSLDTPVSLKKVCCFCYWSLFIMLILSYSKQWTDTSSAFSCYCSLYFTVLAEAWYWCM